MIPEEDLVVSMVYIVNIEAIDVEDMAGHSLAGASQWKFTMVAWYKDSDGDGYSDGTVAINQFDQPAG